MPSVSHELVAVGLRVIRAQHIFASAEAARAHLAQRAAHPKSSEPPRRLRADVIVERIDRDGWPIYALRPANAKPSGSVVYTHGGAWVNEIAVQHWHLAAQIAAESTTTVVVPIYPLIPFGNAAAVVAGIAALAQELEREHGAVILAGDSAGGQISLSAAMLLRDRHGVRATLTLLISPGLDGSLSNPLIEAVQPSDPWLARDGLRVFIDDWRGELAIDDPRVSPLFGDFAGLGPICIFHGTRDILNPDARLFVTAARAAGVSVDDHEGDGLVHVYPLTPTREGRVSRALIVERVREALTRG